jgi:chemotaxis response regulator CheB
LRHWSICWRRDGAAQIFQPRSRRAIKEAGGVVLVQEPSDAEYPMMPQNAIATGAADFIGSIGELP